MIFKTSYFFKWLSGDNYTEKKHASREAMAWWKAFTGSFYILLNVPSSLLHMFQLHFFNYPGSGPEQLGLPSDSQSSIFGSWDSKIHPTLLQDSHLPVRPLCHGTGRYSFFCFSLFSLCSWLEKCPGGYSWLRPREELTFPGLVLNHLLCIV